MSWGDDMDALHDELLLWADYPQELEASDPKPVLPSTSNSHPNTMNAGSMMSDGGQHTVTFMSVL